MHEWHFLALQRHHTYGKAHPQAPRALGFCLFGSLKAQGNRLKIHISAAQADTQMGLQVFGQIQSRAALLGAFEEFHSLIGDRDERP